MSDNNNILIAESDQTIPRFVGQYRKGTEKTPTLHTIDPELQLTKAEKRVSDFFKCTVNWDESEDKEPVDTNCTSGVRHKCFATRQTTLYFEMHLKEKHKEIDEKEKFFCVYCYHSLSNKTFLKRYPHNYLIKHMLNRHRFRRFQCNLCLYRAITEEHLIVHQKTGHSSEYSKAIAETNHLSDENMCKIFFCPKVTDEYRNLLFYWNKYKEKRFNSQGKNETYYQCLYCSFMDEQLQKVIEHCVERHPDYPILYYIPDPQVSSSTFIELNHNLNTCDSIAVVRPKLEPQEDIVSSTQKSPETIDTTSQINSIEDRRRRISLEEEQNNIKRIRVNSSDRGMAQNIQHLTKESNVQKTTICLFCEQTFPEPNDAKSHLKSHFESVDNDRDKDVVKWIQTFVSNQWLMCSFTNSDTLSSGQVSYYCPLCLKLGKIHNKFAKPYESFSAVRKHLWHHCCWLTVRCKVKECRKYIANCDSIIAQHFNNDPKTHYKVLNSEKFQFLLTNESDVSFDCEERLELENKCIKVKRNSVIDRSISEMLVQIKEDFLRTHISRRELGVKMTRISDKEYNKYIRQNEVWENWKEKQSKTNSKISSQPKETSCHKSSSNESNNSNNSTEKVVPNRDLLDDIYSMKNNLTSTSTASSYATSDTVNRNRLLSSESMDTEANRDSDTDNSTEEKLARISCYHCNDKFKTKSDFKHHSYTKHPNLPQRMYAKPRKTNN